MTTIRSEPCNTCPYRRDVPSGVWSVEEYEKLREFDRPMADQPQHAFACHATPEHYCSGWGAVGGFDMLALRVRACAGHPAEWDGVIPEPSTALFASHTEAADHGMRDVDAPSIDALTAMDRLFGKYPDRIKPIDAR